MRGKGRPATATVLLQELESLQTVEDHGVDRPTARLSRTHREGHCDDEGRGNRVGELRSEGQLPSPASSGRAATQSTDWQDHLIGNHWSFYTADDNPPYLKIISALQRAGPVLNRARKRSGRAPRFEFVPSAHQLWRRGERSRPFRWAIRRIRTGVEGELAEAERFRLFDECERQLRARSPRGPSRSGAGLWDASVDGQRARFTLIEPPSLGRRGSTAHGRSGRIRRPSHFRNS